jgi:hypothetical protein
VFSDSSITVPEPWAAFNAAGVSHSNTRPWSMIATRSHNWSASSI